MVRSRAIAVIACVSGLLWTANVDGTQPSSPNGDRVVLITLDGARTQEIFGGLDLAILKSTLKKGESLERNATYLSSSLLDTLTATPSSASIKWYQEPRFCRSRFGATALPTP